MPVRSSSLKSQDSSEMNGNEAVGSGEVGELVEEIIKVITDKL